MKTYIFLFLFLAPLFAFSQEYDYGYNYNNTENAKKDSVYHQGQWRRKPQYDSMWVEGKVVYRKDYVYHEGKYRKKPGKDSVWYNGDVVSEKYRDRIDYETYFMPGVGYSYYSPEQPDSTGNFSGFTVDYLLYAQSHQDDDFGPSHIRFYAKLNLANSDKADISKLFVYSLGLQMSIEKNPKRYWLIPYFGFEAGGISHKTLGNTFAFYPLAGLHVFATQNFYVNLHGGYCYPVNNFEYLSGYFVQGTVNFALW